MKIEARLDSGVLVMSPEGRIDLSNAGEFKALLAERIGGGNERLLINLGAVEYMDSAALGAMISALKLIRTGDGELCLANLNSRLKNLFKLTRMERVFDIYETEAEALGAMSAG